MKSVYTLTAALQLTHLVGENPPFVFSFETRALQYRLRQSFLGSNNGRPSFRTTTSARSMNSKPEEYDDGIGDITNPDKNTDGEDLVAEFYKNLQERNDIDAGVGVDYGDRSPVNKAIKDAPLDLGKPSPSSSLGLEGTGSLFDTDDYYDTDETIPKTPKRKFTGSDYFGGAANDDSSRNQVRENMMRREYELVSGATGRTALTFQVGLALSMLVFFLYVGLTGGIVSGEDAIQMDFGGDDMLQFEDFIPVPRDSDKSVWI